MKRISNLFSAFLVASFLLAGCSDDTASANDDPAPESQTLVQVAQSVNEESGEFSVLLAALQRADLVGALQTNDQLTVFAPTDAAFSALLTELGASGLDDIDDETLSAVLLYHVVPGRLMSETVLSAGEIETLNGASVYPRDTEAAIVDENDRVSNILVDAGLFDIEASNGVIHVIDRVLLP